MNVEKMLLVLLSLVFLLFIIYSGVALIMYVWIGGQSTVANGVSNAFVSIFDFYLMKEAQRDMIPIEEMLLIYKEHKILIELVEGLLIVVFMGVVQVACAIAIEGARMNFQFSKSLECITTNDKSRALYWLRSGIKELFSKLWRN